MLYGEIVSVADDKGEVFLIIAQFDLDKINSTRYCWVHFM